MPLRPWVLTILLLFSWAQSAARDFTGELTRLIEFSDSEQFKEAIDGYRRFANDPGSPPWLKAGSHYDIAELYARQGDRKAAAAALVKAIELGFDDCQSPLTSKHLAAVVKAPDVQQRVRNIAIAETDSLELLWLKSEVDHAEHDAKMMITENMNRVDQQETPVPQAVIPTRRTESAGVLYWRQQLRIMQAAQRRYVLESDSQRMVHAATMQGINGGGSAAAMVESARQAHALAEARRLDIQRRAFKFPAGVGALIRPCS